LEGLKERLQEQQKILQTQFEANSSTGATEEAIRYIRERMRDVAGNLAKANGYLVRPEEPRARSRKSPSSKSVKAISE
jgi:hypothetical protein